MRAGNCTFARSIAGTRLTFALTVWVQPYALHTFSYGSEHAENPVAHHVTRFPVFGLAVTGNSVEELCCLCLLLSLWVILCFCTQNEIC